VLVGQFRVSLLAFAILLCVGTLALHSFYVDPDAPAQRLDWAEALHATFKLIFFETLLKFPRTPGLRILFFILPPIGLAVVADGVLRFGVALFNIRERKEAWQMAIASTYHDHIIVCGLGRTGYRVVKVLLRLGEEVIGVEHDADSPFLEDVREMKVPVLLGDARHEDMLDQARVQKASAIVICTKDDLTSLAIALEAREINPEIKVVMRMFDAQLAEKVQSGFGIHTAFSTSAMAAPVFAAAATRAQIDHSFYVDDILMNVARTTIQPGSALEGRTIADVEKELDISIILYKGLDVLDMHPAPDITLHPDDYLVVFASLDALSRLHKMNGERSSPPRREAGGPRRRSWLARLLSREQ
jgi:Trk K+ transport system NAD-binding subunit